MERLADLQRWLIDSITAPGSTLRVEDHILPSNHQSAADRLAVYQHAYLARLLEVLQNLFPCSRFAAGDELFRQFATGYIQAYPPRSYTLAHLADHFADYLDATRPADWGAFLVELVRLEQAIDRIFDAPGPEGLLPFAMPADADGSLRLRLVPGCELHAFCYPVSTYYTQWKQATAADWPQAGEQYVALFRCDYVVRRYELIATQYAVLSALQAGESLGDALAMAADRYPAETESLARGCQAWFAFWAAERLFAGTPSPLAHG